MGKDSGLIDITPRTLTDEEHLVIGRIVRVAADLEDCLNLWICKLAGTDEARSAVFLGRSNISTKIAIAQSLASLRGDDWLKRHNSAFTTNIDQLLRCRNAVAHGALVGESDDDHLVFVTNNTVSLTEANLERRADAYSLVTLDIIASTANVIVSMLDEFLELGALRKKRQWQQVPAVPERQPKGKKASKPKRPRESSPA